MDPITAIAVASLGGALLASSDREVFEAMIDDEAYERDIILEFRRGFWSDDKKEIFRQFEQEGEGTFKNFFIRLSMILQGKSIPSFSISLFSRARRSNMTLRFEQDGIRAELRFNESPPFPIQVFKRILTQKTYDLITDPSSFRTRTEEWFEYPEDRTVKSTFENISRIARDFNDAIDDHLEEGRNKVLAHIYSDLNEKDHGSILALNEVRRSIFLYPEELGDKDPLESKEVMIEFANKMVGLERHKEGPVKDYYAEIAEMITDAAWRRNLHAIEVNRARASRNRSAE